MKNKHEYLGQSVIFRRLGQLDLGVVTGTKGDGLKITSCTTQRIYVIHTEPLPVERLEKTFDFLRGKEEPCKELIDHVELIKYRNAWKAQADLIGSILDTAENSWHQEYEEHDALHSIMKMIDNSRDARSVNNDKPF